MFATSPEFDKVRFLRGFELGWLPAQPALNLRDSESFAGAGPGEASNSAIIDSTVKLADWIGGVVDRAADVEPDATVGEFVDDVAASGTDRASRSSSAAPLSTTDVFRQ